MTISLRSRVEFDFLRFAASLLRGRRGARGARPLRPSRDGLTRDAEGIPLLRALRDHVPRAVVGFLADSGGLLERRYVLRGRARRGRLLLDPLRGGLGPLTFGPAVLAWLEHLHDRGEAPPPEDLAAPKGAWDRLALYLIAEGCGAGAPEPLLAVSPLSGLFDMNPTLAPEAARQLADGGADALVVRALDRALGARWAGHLARAYEMAPEVSRVRLTEVGATLDAFLAAFVALDRHDALSALLRFYRVVLCELRGPEAILEQAAEGARAFRKVSDREAYLRAHGAVFQAAAGLEAEVAALRARPYVEREDAHTLFLDEYASEGADLIPRAEALHRALTQTLK